MKERGRSGDPVDREEGGGTILLVDDDEDTRSSIRGLLETSGFEVLEAEGPARASELAERHGSAIDLVVLDVIMPGMSGMSVADRLSSHVQDLRILYVSGYIEGELPERKDGPGISAFLQKPFTAGELLAGVKSLVGRA